MFYKKICLQKISIILVWFLSCSLLVFRYARAADMSWPIGDRVSTHSIYKDSLLSAPISIQSLILQTQFSSQKFLPANAFLPGKTKILLVNVIDKEKVELNYPLGIYTLKSHLENNYQDKNVVQVMDMQFDSIEDIIDFIKKWNPHILGLSVKTENSRALEEFMQKSRNSIPMVQAPLYVVGRQVATFGYQYLIKKYPDAIFVRGEGELALSGLGEFVRGERNLADVNNIVYVDGSTTNLIETERVLVSGFEEVGHINHPDLGKYMDAGANIWMEASRGCPWGLCRFCSITEFWGEARRRREKSVDEIIAELKLFSDNGLDRVTFSDEEFFGFGLAGVKRANKIARKIIENDIKISFHIDIRAASIWNSKDSPQIRQFKIETLKLLKQAGLKTVFMGLETGSETQLKRYRKGSDVKTAEQAIKIYRELGINIAVGFIILEPLVSKQEILESIDFIRRNKLLAHLSVPLNRLRLYYGEPYINDIRKEERNLGRELISNEFNSETLIYKIKDYKYPTTKVIVNFATQYAEEEYDLFNAIRWFERFNPRIFGTEKKAEYIYLKQAADESKEYQIDFLYQLANLSDEDLREMRKPNVIFRDAVKKRDAYITRLKANILKQGHASECSAILNQISKYLEKTKHSFNITEHIVGTMKVPMGIDSQLQASNTEKGILCAI